MENYNWKRFWAPIEKLACDCDDFLLDPESNSEWFAKGEYVTLEKLPEKSLILLGEPGIGKSYELNRYAESLKVEIRNDGNQCLILDLAYVDTLDRLDNELFKTKEFIKWVESSSLLYLFFDSLDEGLSRFPRLLNYLIEKFKSISYDRLFVFVACKTAIWNVEMNAQFKSLLPSAETLALLPLRKIDIAEALNLHKINFEKFMGEIEKKRLGPLTNRPITLEMLIQSYKEKQCFPSNEVETFKFGILSLCTPKKDQNIDEHQILKTASWIAAAMVLGNYISLLDENNISNRDSLILDLRELAIPIQCGNTLLENTLIMLRKTINTGLFVSKENYQIGWAHLSYANYLAAKFIAESSLSDSQILSLLCMSDGHCYEQTRDLSVWVTFFRPALLKSFIDSDIEFLLCGNVSVLSEMEKEKYLKILFEKYDKNELLFPDSAQANNFINLKYSQISNFLAQIIFEKTNKQKVRRIAIEFAIKCELLILEDQFLVSVLDRNEELQIRKSAALFIMKKGNNRTKEKLACLVIPGDPFDEMNDLKGISLVALWPGLMSTREMFDSLTIPTQDFYYGWYRRFLDFDLFEKLCDDDLEIGLDWIIENHSNSKFGFRELEEKILLRSIRLFTLELQEKISDIVVLKIERKEEIFRDRKTLKEVEELFAEETISKCFIEVLLPKLSRLDQNKMRDYSYFLHPFVTCLDGNWVIELIKQYADPAVVKVLAYILWWKVNEHSPFLDQVFELCEKNDIVNDIFNLMFQPVELNSEDAEFRKKVSEKGLQRDETVGERIKRKVENIENLLKELECGNIDIYKKIDRQLLGGIDGKWESRLYDVDLTKLSLWIEINDELRKRMVSAAHVFVKQYSLPSLDWFDTNAIRSDLLAGFRAFYLILIYQGSLFESVSQEVFEKWIPVFVNFYYLQSEPQEIEKLQKLIQKAYLSNPDLFLTFLQRAIYKEDKNNSSFPLSVHFNSCFDSMVSCRLMDILQKKDISLKTYGEILGFLLSNKDEEAIRFSVSSLEKSPTESMEITYVNAFQLLCHKISLGWKSIFSNIINDNDWGSGLIKYMASMNIKNDQRIFEIVPDEDVLHFYNWFENAFPHSEDIPFLLGGAEFVIEEENIGDLRDSLINMLVERGTQKACETLLAIKQQHPELSFLAWKYLEALQNFRIHNWTPIKFYEFQSLLKNPEARIINNEQDLANVICESLIRLEQKFHDETPAVRDVWDNVAEIRPKVENDFSDYIKRALEQDLSVRGVVINREVQIRRGNQKMQGQVLDLHVDAISKDLNDRYKIIRTIVEVKGCWNDRLKKDMKEQLVERYLKENSCSTGIYLVGWFMCDIWTEKDQRKKQVPKWSLEEARTFFNNQAEELSQSGKKIIAITIDASYK